MTEARRPSWKRRRLVTGILSLAGHAAVLLAVSFARPEPPPAADPPAIQVQLIELRPDPPAPPAPEPAPDPAPPTPAPPKPDPKPAPPKKAVARPARAPPTVKPILAEAGPTVDLAAEVSDAEVASAATAGAGASGGSGGRACNMAGWLQGKLRQDRRVQAAMAGVHRGRPIRVWNGGWVRHPGQEGDGLAAVREAIMWEVAFAPETCRTERVHGLVLLSLNDTPGAARVIVGSGDWKWSDLVSRSRR